MAGSQSGAVVAMKILVEEQVVAPMRIGLEFLSSLAQGPAAACIAEKMQVSRSLMSQATSKRVRICPEPVGHSTRNSSPSVRDFCSADYNDKPRTRSRRRPSQRRSLLYREAGPYHRPGLRSPPPQSPAASPSRRPWQAAEYGSGSPWTLRSALFRGLKPSWTLLVAYDILAGAGVLATCGLRTYPSNLSG